MAASRPLSLQTSEIAKICYIFAGAATLDRLFNKRNLWMFIGLTAICGGCLALQNTSAPHLCSS